MSQDYYLSIDLLRSNFVKNYANQRKIYLKLNF